MVAAVGCLAFPYQSATATPAPTGTAVSHVIVTGHDGASTDVDLAVHSVGGTVTRPLSIINGVAADIPAGSESQLRAAAAVRLVSPDQAGRTLAVDPKLGYDVNADDGSMNLIESAVGAKTSWKNGYTGKGVDVALIDSGVSPVAGLTSGNVINGPDLSFDSQNPDLTDLDGFGHGTHLASIIAGRDAAGTPAQYAANTSSYLGMAPDARLVSVKVASGNGAADVSQVIAAIEWVDQHAHSNGLNIRVLNLSFGTNSTQDANTDPLAYAVEQAWLHGIVVVVAGGNDGKTTRTLADPAYDPAVLAVGASDPMSTVTSADDAVASFNTRGKGKRHVDVLAPGVHVLGLRDPGSAVDQNNPDGAVGTRFIRGSGTSQAAAVVSGAAALLVQRYPNATPDQIKRQLMDTAQSTKASTVDQGNGVINVAAAEARALNNSKSVSTDATGSGSLEAARGGAHVDDGYGHQLLGEQDIFGNAWVPSVWAAATSRRQTWAANGSWNGAVWAGTTFDNHSWTGSAWASQVWTRNSWSGGRWTDSTWTSHHWTAGGWDSHHWTDNGWDSHHWTDANWASTSWN